MTTLIQHFAGNAYESRKLNEALSPYDSPVWHVEDTDPFPVPEPESLRAQRLFREVKLADLRGAAIFLLGVACVVVVALLGN